MKLLIGISIVVVSFSIFYYLVIFLPKQNDEKLQQQVRLEGFKTDKQITNQQKLQQCLDNVDQRLSNPTVAVMLKQIKTTAELNTVLDAIKQKKDECYKEFPIQ